MKIRNIRIFVAAFCALTGASLNAQTFTWVPTAAGTTYDWFTSSNWDPNTGFPNAAGATANLNNNIVGNQTIRLQQAITVGTLNIGDDVSAFTVGNEGAETFALIFDSGVMNTAAQINLSSTGTPTNSLAVPVTLGSNLNVNFGTGSQILQVSTTGSLATGSGANARTITVVGGASTVSQFNILGDLSGEGTIINNSNTAMSANSTAKSFTGTFILNKGIGPSNTGSLTVTNGSIANAAEVVINGALSAGAVQSGGSLHSGNNSATTINPGQRLTLNRFTLNGGSINASGQSLSGAALNTEVADNVSVLDFNSGYSLITTGASTSQSGTRLNIATIERTTGATAFIRSGTLGGTARVIAGNSASLLGGASGAEGSTTMSLIPWMVAANTNGFAGSADTFATHTATGIRGLLASEYTSTITAGAGNNYSAGNVVIAGTNNTVTVNTARYTTAGSSNMGVGNTLVLESGGLIFTVGGGTIGALGNAAAGTLQFGVAGDPTEGVVWVNTSNTNTIGASLSGTMGLTKAGTGTLILGGANTFTGLTYVSSGTLQIGNGTNFSNLGVTGDVTVANGATLSLFNSFAIADDAMIRLENFGLLNGRMNIGSGLNETVGGLFFNNALASAGTYGSTLSSATFQNDTYFSGAGVLTVVPEPGSLAMLIAGVGAMLGFRRRRS